MALDAWPADIRLGQIVSGLVGIAVAIAGWYIEFPPEARVWARPVCNFGLIARGVVWCIIVWFLIDSAIQARAGEIEGMAGALDAVRSAGYGPWLLGIVAAGLFAFGIYSFLEALYRRVNVHFDAA